MRLVLLSCVALLAACASAPVRTTEAAPQKENLSRYYPLAVGNSWTYATRFGKRVERNSVTIVAREGAFFRDDRNGKLTFDADGLRDGSRYLIRGPLERGRTWVSQLDPEHRSHFEILDTDATAEVPAGKFDHVLIVKAVDDAKDGAMELEFAYAPGVGLVRISTTKVMKGGERVGQVTIELVSFALK